MFSMRRTARCTPTVTHSPMMSVITQPASVAIAAVEKRPAVGPAVATSRLLVSVPPAHSSQRPVLSLSTSPTPPSPAAPSGASEVARASDVGWPHGSWARARAAHPSTIVSTTQPT